jgi:eukaryotic-like serine/threonine-protein kinase
MSLFDTLRRSFGRNSRHAGGHMTWASRSLSHSLTSTRLFLKKQLWVWPIIAFFVLAALGWTLNRSIETTMRENTQSELETLLSAEQAMLVRWMATQEHNAEAMANNAETRRLVGELLKAADTESPSTDRAALNKQLAASLGPAMTSHGYVGFGVVDRTKTVIAGSDAELIGGPVQAANAAGVGRALDGVASVLAPYASVATLQGADGVRRTGVPTMFVAAPVRDENLQVVAVLGLRINPLRDFTKILDVGQFGSSGETYAFNRDGLMLSSSRFDDDLIRLAVLPDRDDAQSILQVLVRDPGGNLEEGYRPSARRSALPPTRMVAAAREGLPGVDVIGYRDYRGVPVVGAWTWLDKYDFGLATEINRDEAFLPLTILKRFFWSLLVLLALSSIAIFVFTIMLARSQRAARAATIEAKQLGQYQLEQKLGAGAMGVVYRGRHAMLRRPTAIKLLDADKVTDLSIGRFEREVQITSQLTHPNTVQIFDFGRTPEGVFYYAMEYLEGIDLQLLVDQYGPQPAGRVIHILRQVCGSLYEAHSTGLVHRDIKPANLMLTRRGGEADVVKVLDFGLVKAREDDPQGGEAQGLAGTPLYMSPEAIQLPNSVDGCSDIYAVGAVGYFLLTGRPVFEAASIVELCNKHVSETPVPPSQRLGKPVPEDLENAILACLEKSRAKRPQTARDLAQRLARCPAATEWSLEDAEAWWARHDRGLAPSKTPTPSESTLSRQYEATIDH